MVEKAKVLAGFQKNNQISVRYRQWFDENYDYAHRIAIHAQQRMPGIGFASAKKRLNAFYTICEVVRNEITREGRNGDWPYAQLVLQIIRYMDSNFDTAAMTFAKMAKHLKPNEIEMLPELAITYAIEYRLGLRI